MSFNRSVLKEFYHNILSELYQSIKTYIVAVFSIIIIMYFLLYLGRMIFPDKAEGSLIYDEDNNIRGSYLLAQEIDSDKYFKPRSTKQNDSTCALSIQSFEFAQIIEKSDAYQMEVEKKSITPMIEKFPSASMRDPYITYEYAMLQAKRIAHIRRMHTRIIEDLINNELLGVRRPFFSTKIVNTTILNDKLQKLK